MKTSSSSSEHFPTCNQAHGHSNLAPDKSPESQPFSPAHESKVANKPRSFGPVRWRHSNLPPGKSPEYQPFSPAHESKVSKKPIKPRSFGSIRCRACNRYGLLEKCPCSPMARYSVMIQSKRISTQHRRQIRRLSFATVEKAETFRKFLAARCFSRPTTSYKNHRQHRSFRHSEPVTIPEPRSTIARAGDATIKRVFGSIRCRACNRYGLTVGCPCSPEARYSVMINSKLISKEHQKKIRRLSFGTVEEAESFRQFVAKRFLRAPIDSRFYTQHLGYDASRHQNHSFRPSNPSELLTLTEPRSSIRRAVWEDGNVTPMSQYSPFNKKRPMSSPLAFQPARQRKCMGLSREHSLPKKDSINPPLPYQPVTQHEGRARSLPIKGSVNPSLHFQSPGQRKRMGLARERSLQTKDSLNPSMPFRPLNQSKGLPHESSLAMEDPINPLSPFQPVSQSKGLPRESSLQMKNSMNRSLSFQPPSQRKGLPRERPLKMKDSSSQTHPMISLWQQQLKSAREKFQQYPVRFGTALTSMAADASSTVNAAAAPSTIGRPDSPIDTPVMAADSHNAGDKRAMEKMMINVVAACLSQRLGENVIFSN